MQAFIDVFALCPGACRTQDTLSMMDHNACARRSAFNHLNMHQTDATISNGRTESGTFIMLSTHYVSHGVGQRHSWLFFFSIRIASTIDTSTGPQTHRRAHTRTRERGKTRWGKWSTLEIIQNWTMELIFRSHAAHNSIQFTHTYQLTEKLNWSECVELLSNANQSSIYA